MTLLLLINELTINALKDKIVSQLERILRVYRDTAVDVNLPTGVNLQEVSALGEARVSLLHIHNIYCDLLSRGMQNEYFLQVI